MKKTQLLTIAMLISAQGAAAQLPTPIAPAPVLPAKAKPADTPKYKLTTSKDWQNPAALRDSLAKKIQARLKGNDKAKGEERARLLLQACRVENMERPDRAPETIPGVRFILHRKNAA